MTQFDFDRIINRHQTGSVKWDSPQDESVLPMWVADMDFRAAEPIIDALKRIVEHGVLAMPVYRTPIFRRYWIGLNDVINLPCSVNGFCIPPVSYPRFRPY